MNLPQISLITALVAGGTFAIARWIEWVDSFFAKYAKEEEMTPWRYLSNLLGLSIGVGVLVFLCGVCQQWLPMNPEGFTNLKPLVAAEMAVAVATHTNWQPFAPETLVSPFTQIFAVLCGNMIIGAICVAVWRAFVRALGRRGIGNARVAIVQGLVILVPLQLVLTIILMSQAVPQDFFAKKVVEGPVAVFIAGNLVSGAGAGWMGDSFSSVIQNPTLISDIASVVMLVAVPLGFLLSTGKLIERKSLVVKMTIAVALTLAAATIVTMFFAPMHVYTQHWPASDALWLNATAGSANGTVNAFPERFEAAGRLPAFLTLLAGIPFPPPVGLGVVTLFMQLLIAIYLGALMVGRSPDFLGFKVRLQEVAAVGFGVLGPQLVILSACIFLVRAPETLELIKTSGEYGMSALLWAIGSWGQNNGSAYQLSINKDIFLETSIVVMALGRLLSLGAAVIFAGLISQQRNDPPILPSVNPQGLPMLMFFICVIVIGGALAMLPLLMFGPVLEIFKGGI